MPKLAGKLCQIREALQEQSAPRAGFAGLAMTTVASVAVVVAVAAGTFPFFWTSLGFVGHAPLRSVCRLVREHCVFEACNVLDAVCSRERLFSWSNAWHVGWATLRKRMHGTGDAQGVWRVYGPLLEEYLVWGVIVGCWIGLAAAAVVSVMRRRRRPVVLVARAYAMALLTWLLQTNLLGTPVRSTQLTAAFYVSTVASLIAASDPT